ncbi:MAG: class I SAM-dependent methyltransferase [Myxococcota bacterium]
MTSPGKISVELGPVQETLLIPLLGRAEETKKKRGLLRDPKAVEMVAALDYDFAKWHGVGSLSGSALRARIFDEQVQAFLERHPGGTIVEIGAGLNTRYERLDNGQASWLELDLPDSMALRQRFFEDTERRTMLAASVLDSDWHERVAALPAPYCFVSEAVLIYLDNGDVERVLRALNARFADSWLVTDTASSAFVDGQHKHDAIGKMSPDSWCRWKCDDPQQLADWGLKLERSLTFLDISADIRAALPLHYRLILGFAPWLIRRRVQTYRMNRFLFTGVDGNQT